MQSETLVMFLCVGAGAAISGMIRFAATKVIDSSMFPWAAFAVNIMACFIAAFFATKYAGAVNDEIRLFMTVGMMGDYPRCPRSSPRR